MIEARTIAGNAGVSLSRTNVLLVAGDAEQRERLRSALEGLGARVTEAGSQKAALGIIDYTVPDVVIQCLRSVHEDGGSVLHRMRTLDEQIGCTTPAIAVTEPGFGPGLGRLVEVGYQAFLRRADEAKLARTVVRLTGQERNGLGHPRYMSAKRAMLRSLRTMGRDGGSLKATA